MSDTTSPDSAGLAPPLPPFSPVQVTSSLPPLATEGTQKIFGELAIHRRENPTGLSRAEIRLLTEAVSAASGWRGTLVGNPDPEPLARFDARIAKMKAAIRKLKAASGYNFSGRKKK